LIGGASPSATWGRELGAGDSTVAGTARAGQVRGSGRGVSRRPNTDTLGARGGWIFGRGEADGDFFRVDFGALLARGKPAPPAVLGNRACGAPCPCRLLERCCVDLGFRLDVGRAAFSGARVRPVPSSCFGAAFRLLISTSGFAVRMFERRERGGRPRFRNRVHRTWTGVWVRGAWTGVWVRRAWTGSRKRDRRCSRSRRSVGLTRVHMDTVPFIGT
jgi:hypothetical protein